MMDLVIIILVMMQPNEVNSISFHHSSLHHSPYELDDMSGMVFGCLSEIESCVENHMWRRISVYVECVIDTFHHCILMYNEPTDDPELVQKVYKKALSFCLCTKSKR